MRINNAPTHILVSALLVAAILTLSAPPAQAAVPCWKCWGPGLPDPCRNTLYSVAIVPGSNGNDVWAVGARGTILHWNGAAWSKITSPTTEILRYVAMARADLGLAVGYEGVALKWNGTAWTTLNSKTTNWFRAVAFTPGSNGANGWAAADKYGVGLFERWNGTGLEDRPNSKNHFFGNTIWGISMVSTNAGWAVGEALSGTPLTMKGQIRKWDGSNWGMVDTPVAQAGPYYAVDMLSTTDGWTVGRDGVIARWDGSAWAQWPSSPTTEHLRAVDLRTTSDGWAVGDGGAILRWNGSAWTSVASPVSLDLYGVAVAAANKAWAVGAGGAILLWNGTTWSKVFAPDVSRLDDVQMTPGTLGADGWAVGLSSKILHWNGTTWSPVQGPRSSYYAVAPLSRTDAWAAAQGNRFARWNGTAWAEAGTWQSALDIAMLSPTNGWAVGWGKIQHWDGSTWSLVTSPSTRTYYGMDAVSPTDIWAVGDSGTIIHYDGSGWSSAASPAASYDWLVDVSMASATDGWIVGSPGIILGWNGSAWAKYNHSMTDNALRGVSVLRGASGTVGWAVGDGGEVYWLSSNAWTAGCSPTGNDLWAVHMISPYEAWAVGDNGVILHWDDPNRPGMAKRVFLPILMRP